MLHTFKLSSAETGILDSAYFVTYALLQIPGGLLLSHLGPKRVLTAASLTCAIGLLLFATAHNFTVAIFARFIMGLGGSFGLMGAVFLACRCLPTRYLGFFVGLTIMLGLSGGLVQTPLHDLIIAFNWRNTVLILAALSAGIALLMAFFIQDNAITKENLHSLSWRHLYEDIKKVAKNRAIWPVAIYGGLMYLPTGTLSSLWGIEYLKTYYPSVDMRFLTTINAAFFLGWIIGSPLSGFISDFIHQRKPLLTLSSAGVLVCMLAVTYVDNLSLGVMGLLFLLMGVFSSGSGLTFAMAAELYPRQHQGPAIGLVNMLAILPSILCAPIFGYILDNVAHAPGTPIGAYTREGFTHAMILEYGIIVIALLMALWWIKETLPESSSI
jgi:MFS family permease